jgi:predicted transcriptional regulator
MRSTTKLIKNIIGPNYPMLTTDDLRVFLGIEYLCKNKTTATHNKLMKILNMPAGSVNACIKRMVRLGLLSKEDKSAGTIRPIYTYVPIK